MHRIVRNGVLGVDTHDRFPAIEKSVFADCHIAHAAGFKPTPGIGIDQDAAHLSGEELVILNDHLSPTRDKKATGWDTPDLAAADLDVRIPGDIFQHVGLPDGLRSGFLESEKDVDRADEAGLRDAVFLEARHGIRVHELDFITGVEGHESEGLLVNEAHFNLAVREALHHAQVSAVNVDGVIVSARKDAVLYKEFTTTAGDLDAISPRRSGPATLVARSDGDRVEGEVF